jgi:hypothetical protein
MIEPSPESVQRGVAALMPFQRGYKLPVNPEDLAAMAYAVLRFANTTKPLPEIVEEAEKLVADHVAQHMWQPEQE